MSKSTLEWVKILGPLLLSWQVVIFVVVLIFREQIVKLFERFMGSEEGTATFGPIKIELRKLARQGKEAVNNFNELNVLMAKSRLLELKITKANFSKVLTPEQLQQMEQQIDELQRLTTDLSE